MTNLFGQAAHSRVMFTTTDATGGVHYPTGSILGIRRSPTGTAGTNVAGDLGRAALAGTGTNLIANNNTVTWSTGTAPVQGRSIFVAGYLGSPTGAVTAGTDSSSTPTVADMRKAALIYSISMIAAGASTPTFDLQDHAGIVSLIPMLTLGTTALTASALIWDFPGGLWIPGGFRVVTGGGTLPIIQVNYAVLPA